jgi:predicted TIM-barrel fold metal-dependent hydrolase
MLPLISLEEHYISDAVYKSPSIKKLGLDLFPPAISERLLSLGSRRIADMDAGAISVQVISHTPGVEPSSLEICIAANEELYRAVENNKSRYVGFAMLPMNDPPAAAAELERCVQELSFVGALVPNHAYGRYYDDEHFWPVFSTAQKLDVPIYLHPTSAAVEKRVDFDGNYPPEFAAVLSAYGWGWHSDTGLHFLKLYGAGSFRSVSALEDHHWTYGRDVAIYAGPYRAFLCQLGRNLPQKNQDRVG